MWSLVALLALSNARAGDLLPPLAVSLPAGGAQDPGPHGVWQGTTVGAGVLRSVVALYVGDEEGDPLGGGGGTSTFCSGTLIDAQWVLTAAHCLNDVESYLNSGAHLWVGFGAASPFDARAEWSSSTPHPQFRPAAQAGSGFDLAVVRLATAMTGEPVMPVNSEPVDGRWVGLPLTLAGYGVTDDGLEDSGRKRMESAPLIRYAGDLVFAFNGTVTYDRVEDMLNEATYDADSNLCQGDSGGATLAETSDGAQVLVAVNAVVSPGCAHGAAGSTRVDPFIDWITGFVSPTLAQPDLQSVSAAPDYTVDVSPPGQLVLPERASPILPSDGASYPKRAACVTGPSGQVGWLALVGMALVVSRRRQSR